VNNSSRRKFLLTSLGATAGTLFSSNVVTAKDQDYRYEGGLITGQPNPLHYKSIPGFLSEEQITPHYKAHYGGALRGYIAADKAIQTSITEGTKIDSSAYGSIQRARTNKADSVILHELYFDGMTSKASTPNEKVLAMIKKRFGSLEKWSADFQVSAKSASGWAILAFQPLNGKLYNVVSDKHATGVPWMAIPLVVIDVYEHAYYVDYKNSKTLYIEKFLEHINWGEVNRRFKIIS
jgi:Fe-Mn family superoxide dismutase